MFTNTNFQRSAKAARFLALAVIVAATAPAYAAGNGHGGGGSGGGTGDGAGNKVLECLGADCINVSQANVNCTANYCKEEKKHRDSCEVRVCNDQNGKQVCRITVSYDERICEKNEFF